MSSKLCIYLLPLLLACYTLQAQEKTVNKDSTKVYQKIENYSKKSKVNGFIYRLLFRSSRKSTPSVNSQRKKYFIKKAFDRNEGKIIRSINIETLDPFGYAVDNYKDVPEKGFEKFGNSLHLKTKNWTIRNLLLIKKNEPLDSLLAKESERLVRRQRYVRSVIIKPVEIPNCKDSIDISVRVLDSWSLIPTGSVSGSQGSVELTERNFMGLGHEFENDFNRRFQTGQNAYKAKYTISNIKNTFISTSFGYENSYDNYTNRSIRVERPFFSAFTRLAGGIYLENRFYKDSLPDATMAFAIQTFKLKTQEFWFGHSFKIFGGKSEDYRSTNFITTVGFKNVHFLEEPSLTYDPNKFFASEKLYLGTIGLNVLKTNTFLILVLLKMFLMVRCTL